MKSLTRIFIVVALISLTAANTDCQIRLDLKKKLENKVNQKVNQTADKAIDHGAEAVENDIKGDAKNTDSANENQKAQDNKQTGGNNANQEDKPLGQEQPALQAYSKYDFIPGEKVIFFEDFSQDAVGDFPALWNTNGSAEVVTTNLFPGNWMRFICREAIWTDNLLKLPDNYTIEFDVMPIAGENGQMSGYNFRLMEAKNAKAFDYGSAPGNGGFHLNIAYFGTPYYNTWFTKSDDCLQLQLNGIKDSDPYKQKLNEKYHMALWIQKTRLRVYQNEIKLIDLPKALPSDCVKPDRLRFEDGAAMISNIRIAVGAPDMRNKLMTDGKLVTYGIYFDVNKDVVKPESYGTLKEIATILNEVPDVKVKIVGHTDSDGADAANLDLSKRRAASVKNELVKSFGVNGDRISTDGLGEGQPVAPNDTPANKALNRRVEFIKQ